MRRLGLRARITLWCTGVLLLILAPYAAFVLALQWRETTSQLNHHLGEDLEVALEMLVADEHGVHWRTEDPLDPGYDAGETRWVEIWDETGARVYTRGTPWMRQAQAALPPPDGWGYRTVAVAPGPMRSFTARRAIAGRPLVVRVARSEAEMREGFRSIVLIFLIGVPLGLAAAAAGGYVVAGRALAPVGAMAAQAASISAERLHARLPVGNPEDELGRLATVFNDTFARLEESFERLRRFTADASHELRTPLTALRSVGEVALSGPRDAEAYREVIGSMLEEADRLRRLVDGLLTLSRGDSGVTRISRESVDLVALAQSVVADLGVLAEEKSLAVSVEVTAPASVPADRLVLRQAIINLFDNAIKYSPDGGRIVVRVGQGAGEARLAVIDEGPGIAPEDHRRVFDRFFRSDKARSRDVGGSGLGLAIAAWAASAHGGRIDLESTPGRGSTFTIVLPAIPAS